MGGTEFRLIDTGGVDIADPSPITRSIADQARAAVAEADIVLFVVDAQIGITPGDEEVAQILREARKPVFLLANKIDDPAREEAALEFHRLGLGDPIPLSAMHGHGTGDLLDAVVARLPGSGPAQVSDEAIRVAILGRPNVGKSSLLNAILGEERVIVSEVPGTTRDAIDTVFRRGETTFVLVDTAGLRRKRRQRQGIEYYSELRALDAADRADIALVLVDASEGLVDQDLAVADVARRANDATLVVLSKWDIGRIKVEDVRPRLEHRLRQRPGVVTLSAKTGRGVTRLLDRIEELFARHDADLDARAERLPPGAPRRPRAALARPSPAQPPVRHPDPDAPAALPLLRQRSGPRHPRLRLLGRKPASRAVRARRRTGLDRLRPPELAALVAELDRFGAELGFRGGEEVMDSVR